MSKVVRVSYLDPDTGKKKFLQTNINIHGSKEKAKEFLNHKKDVILKKGKQEDAVVKITTKDDDDDNDDDKFSNEKYDEFQKLGEEWEKELTTSTNLMDIPVKSNQAIQEIIDNLQYSKLNLQLFLEPTGYSICIFGSGKSYKTTLMKRIIKEYFDKNTITVLCATSAHAKIYDDLPKEVIKTDEYCPQIVKAMHKINKKTDNKYNFALFLDDVIDAKSEGNLEKLFCTLRNARLSICILLQSITMLKNSCRANSNIIIFRRFNQKNIIEDYVMKHYLGGFPPFSLLPSMEQKVNLYMAITNKHDFLVLDILNNVLTIHHELELKK